MALSTGNLKTSLKEHGEASLFDRNTVFENQRSWAASLNPLGAKPMKNGFDPSVYVSSSPDHTPAPLHTNFKPIQLFNRGQDAFKTIPETGYGVIAPRFDIRPTKDVQVSTLFTPC